MTLIMKPSAWQQELIMSPARFKVACCGRRSGKTFAGKLLLWAEILKNPELKAWYVALTYTQAKARMWKPLVEGKNALFPAALIKDKSISEQYIELKTGAQIWLKGSDTIDSVLGEDLDYLHMDEFQSQKKDNWDKLRPMLSDRRGSAYISGTPRGFNHFYDIWWKGWHENWTPNSNYEAWQIKTRDAGTISEDEIEDAMRDLSPQMFAQEYEASFQNLMGRVYPCFSNTYRSEGGSIDANISDDTSLPLLVGMDFNVNPMTATVNQAKNNELHTIAEIWLENSNTALMAQTLKDKYPGRTLIIYPDPSGSGRRTAARYNATDHTILREAGFLVRVKKQAPLVSDRVNEQNALLQNAKGVRRHFIHPNCTRLTKSYLGLTYLENGDIDKTGGLDHLPDGHGYLVNYEFPITARGRQYSL